MLVKKNINLINMSRISICLADHPSKIPEIRNIIGKIIETFKAVTHSRMKYKLKIINNRRKLFSDSAYIGFWYDSELKKIIRDDIHLIIIDINTNQIPDYLEHTAQLERNIREVFHEKEDN